MTSINCKQKFCIKLGLLQVDSQIQNKLWLVPNIAILRLCCVRYPQYINRGQPFWSRVTKLCPFEKRSAVILFSYRSGRAALLKSYWQQQKPGPTSPHLRNEPLGWCMCSQPSLLNPTAIVSLALSLKKVGSLRDEMRVWKVKIFFLWSVRFVALRIVRAVVIEILSKQIMLKFRDGRVAASRQLSLEMLEALKCSAV